MQTMTCKNCCAPINPHLDHCEYCGGYFEKPPEETTTCDFYDSFGRKVLSLKKEMEDEYRVKQLYEAALKSMRDYEGRIMTPNEMRATMGLDPIHYEKIVPLKPNCEFLYPSKPKKKLFGSLFTFPKEKTKLTHNEDGELIGPDGKCWTSY